MLRITRVRKNPSPSMEEGWDEGEEGGIVMESKPWSLNASVSEDEEK